MVSAAPMHALRPAPAPCTGGSTNGSQSNSGWLSQCDTVPGGAAGGHPARFPETGLRRPGALPPHDTARWDHYARRSEDWRLRCDDGRAYERVYANTWLTIPVCKRYGCRLQARLASGCHLADRASGPVLWG